MSKASKPVTTEFQYVQGIISSHRSRALQAVNSENLLAAWEVGAFVSARLKNSAWGSKTVMQLSEYLRAQDPALRGYSRRNIYNMVSLYDAYSSAQFIEYREKLKLDEFVSPVARQIENAEIVSPVAGQFVQSVTAQLGSAEILQFETGQIVQTASAQIPNFLELTTLSNHFEILNTCKTIEERIFYVLYAYKERLTHKELQRCLKNNTFASLMGDKRNLSKGLKKIYPQAVPMLKDTLFLDFLGLPQKHSEKRLQRGILGNLKDFVLELGNGFSGLLRHDLLRNPFLAMTEFCKQIFQRAVGLKALPSIAQGNALCHGFTPFPRPTIQSAQRADWMVGRGVFFAPYVGRCPTLLSAALSGLTRRSLEAFTQFLTPKGARGEKATDFELHGRAVHGVRLPAIHQRKER